MIATTRASLTATIAVLAVSLAGFLLLGPADTAGAAPLVIYQHESFEEYEQQLAGGQVRSVEINKRVGSVRVTLENGQRFVAKFKRKEEKKVAAAAQAKGVPVSVLKPTEASKEVVKVKKTIHHKLRYIAGGILIVVIVIVGAVLFISRKRKRDAEE
jgi:ATP-dependent Zn protease